MFTTETLLQHDNTLCFITTGNTRVPPTLDVTSGTTYDHAWVGLTTFHGSWYTGCAEGVLETPRRRF